ncbi:MAG: sigma-70 family RNA polymerase sigma factor [Phycisphaerales bacterium]|nr:MAG: sigma-70 family RNA polymerase sigma factor [Phycisphaerales bacterium]
MLRAGEPGATGYREALEALCRAYWLPLYAYLRRRGCNCHQAEDYTQGFFARLFERQALVRADPTRGKFRSFLLAALKNFVADERDYAQASKRGGGARALPLDFGEAEARYALAPSDTLSPEEFFDRSWALAALQQAMAKLKAEYAEAGKEHLFERFKGSLQVDANVASYRDMAADVGMSAGAARVAVHRLRRRFRDLVRQEIAQTVSEPAEVDEEVNYLFAVLTASV